MGFFSKFTSVVSRAARKTAEVALVVAEKAAEAAASFVEATADAIGRVRDRLSMSSYDRHSVESRVNVEKALADFREMINERAQEVEKSSIEAAMKHFDSFADSLEDSFPELVTLVRTRQSEAEKYLSNTIIDYVHEHVSENDPEFRAVLEMQPGSEKGEALEARMNQTLEEAESVFGRRLKEQMRLLNEELNVRLEEKLKSVEDTLGNLAEKYESLEKMTTDKTLDIQSVEQDCAPVIEAATCIQHMFGQEEEQRK